MASNDFWKGYKDPSGEPLTADQILKIWEKLPLAERRQRIVEAWYIVVAPLGKKAGNETITLKTLENSEDYSPIIQALRRDHLSRSLLQQASARDLDGQDRAADPDLVAAFLFAGKEDGYVRMRARLLRTARLVNCVVPHKPLRGGFTPYYVKKWLNSLSQEELSAVRKAEAQLPETTEGDIFSVILAELNQVQIYNLDELIAWANRPSKPREAGKPPEEEEEEEDLSMYLPGAVSEPTLTPKPEAPKPAATPTAPTTPDLAALMGGGEAKPQAPKAPAGKKAAAPVAPAASPPVEETKPAAPAVDEENRKLMLAAIQKAAKENPDPVIRTAAAAFLVLKGEKASADEMANFAISRGLLEV